MPKKPLDTSLILYVLLRENHKINAICFPSFHNGCNPACKVWRRIWMGEWHLNTLKLKFDYLKNEKSFQRAFQKRFFLVPQVLSFRHTKQTSKNVADTTFKIIFDDIKAFWYLTKSWELTSRKLQKKHQKLFLVPVPFQVWSSPLSLTLAHKTSSFWSTKMQISLELLVQS